MADTTNQTLIQVRVDNDLKDSALRVLDSLGIEMPTAVRIFLKALVRHQGIPFPLIVNDKADEYDEERSGISHIRNDMNSLYIYSEPELTDAMKSEVEERGLEREDFVVLHPLGFMNEIPSAMYAQLLSKVPLGKITRWEDIDNYLRKIYNLGGAGVLGDYSGIMPFQFDNGEFLPFWRIVSERGVLLSSHYCSKEEQLSRLKEEGIPIVPRGTQGNSFKVDRYKEYLFDFNKLSVLS